MNESALPTHAGWFTVTFIIPAGFTAIHAIGLQLHTAKAGTWIALDALSWPA
jgi:hypothetical protein